MSAIYGCHRQNRALNKRVVLPISQKFISFATFSRFISKERAFPSPHSSAGWQNVFKDIHSRRFRNEISRWHLTFWQSPRSFIRSKRNCASSFLSSPVFPSCKSDIIQRKKGEKWDQRRERESLPFFRVPIVIFVVPGRLSSLLSFPGFFFYFLLNLELSLLSHSFFLWFCSKLFQGATHFFQRQYRTGEMSSSTLFRVVNWNGIFTSKER